MSQLRTYKMKVARLISTDIEESTKHPITPNDAKLYARVDSDVEDEIFDMLIDSAVSEFENYTSNLLFQRQVTVTFDCEGDSILILPYMPVVSITSVQKAGDDVEYELEGDRLVVNTVGKVEVIYQCGLFEDIVTGDAKLGIHKFVTSNYEDRQDVAAMGVSEMPNSSRKHWLRYKRFNL